MNNLNTLVDDAQDALLPGAAAGSAFLVAMWLDNKLSSWSFNDLKLVGQMLTVRSPLWQIQGVGGHFGFSVVMSLLYGRFAQSRLPGPGWLRGILFMMIENAALYPAAVVLDKVHAGMKAGQLPPLLNMKTFLGQLTRHIAFGAVLGLMWGAKRGR